MILVLYYYYYMYLPNALSFSAKWPVCWWIEHWNTLSFFPMQQKIIQLKTKSFLDPPFETAPVCVYQQCAPIADQRCKILSHTQHIEPLRPFAYCFDKTVQCCFNPLFKTCIFCDNEEIYLIALPEHLFILHQLPPI